MKGFAQRHPVALLLASALLVLGGLPRVIDALKAGETAPPALAPGVLLVARPGHSGRTFDGTVVLLLEAGGERTWGLVLNRARTPDGAPLPEGVDRWGGPVHPGFRVTLTDGGPATARRVLDGLSWYEGGREDETGSSRHVRDGRSKDEGAASGGTALTFAGVASWAPGQLEAELARGAWWAVEGHARSVFTPPEVLWAELAARHL